MSSAVRLTLVSPEGMAIGQLAISGLPGGELWNQQPVLLDLRDGTELSQIEAPVQLLEEIEYAYSILVDASSVIVEPVELFNASSTDGLSGRLRPKRSTGTVAVSVLDDERTVIGRCEFEVRARKLDYRSEYRWMLQRIADEAAEILQSRFAASSLGVFRPQTTANAETLYQRFAFIQSLVGSDEFAASLQLILNRPHHEYQTVTRERDPRSGVRAGPSLIRQLLAPGPRQGAEGALTGGLSTLPRSIYQTEHIETFDTVPNRFVRFALEQWRDVATHVEHSVAAVDTPAGRRGVREARSLRRVLEEVLAAPLFRDVGPLEVFPASNTVLQGRPGYRDVLAALLQAEAAAIIDWEGGEAVFAAGQRDVATLYEYWVFFELLRVVATSSGFQVDRKPLLRKSENGLSLELRRGRAVLLKGYGVRRGRVVELELWFNRTFRPPVSSWTEPMRPDCSLRISPAGRSALDMTTWLHFDAKYRVHTYKEIFQDGVPVDEDGQAALSPVPDDLLKMHAYRDAIRRTSAAFVLYPGDDTSPLRRSEYHEILPGLGAFVLRPTANGFADDESAQSLRQFIDDVVDHVASHGTDQERADYWIRHTYSQGYGRRLEASPALLKPPADTKVLLGFVRNPAHLAWVVGTGLYNLRADDRRGSIGLDSPELACDFLCLYSSYDDGVTMFRFGGIFVLKTNADLVRTGYPEPRGQLYCCLVIGDQLGAVSLAASSVRARARHGLAATDWGSPRVVAWTELFTHEL